MPKLNAAPADQPAVHINHQSPESHPDKVLIVVTLEGAKLHIVSHVHSIIFF